MSASVRLRFQVVGLGLLAVFLGSCHTPPAIQGTSTKAQLPFERRSLSDPGLKQFLTTNLGGVPPTWDFESLSWVAFYFNPTLELARAQWAATEAARLTAQARVNPTLSVTPGYDSTRQGGISPWFPAINLDFLLQNNSKRRHQQDIARAEAESARLEVLDAAWTVRSELRTALTEASNAARLETSLQAQALVQRDLLNLQLKRHEIGYSSATEIGAIRVAVLRSESASAEAAVKFDTARLHVAAVLGLPVSALDGIAMPPPLQGNKLSSAALSRARQESLHARADVLSALAKIQAAESAVALETARRYPEFHVGPGYQYDQGLNKWSVALSLELPLFNRNEGPIAEAIAKRTIAAAQLFSIQAKVIGAIESAVAEQTGAEETLARLIRVRDEIAQQDALAQRRFDLGAADQIERQTTRLELLQADAAVAEADAAVAHASGQLEDALQVPFPHFATLRDLAEKQP